MRTRKAISELGAALKNWVGSTTGGIAITFAVAGPALFAVVGLATDYAMFSMKVSQLQAAADTAAIGGAKELALVNSNDQTIKAVTVSYVSEQARVHGSDVSTTVEIDRKSGTLHVTLEEIWTPFFAHFLDAKITPVRVDATASLVGSSSICILALETSTAKAVHLDKFAKISANGCGVYSNSIHPEGIRLDYDSKMTAALVCSAGGYKAKTTASNPLPTTDCPAVPDPLADRAAPVAGGCNHTNYKILSGSVTINPGTYCGGLRVTGSAVANLKPGTYIIKNGALEVSNSAQLIGEHVGFYLTGSAALINFTGDASVSLSGAKEGTMAGLLFFEDRSSQVGRKHRINGSNVDRLTGTIYLSRGDLQIDPNSDVAQDSAYTAIIAHKLLLDEGPELIMNSDYGATDVPVPAGIRAAAQVVLSK